VDPPRPGSICPRCGTARVGSFRYCRACQFDFEKEVRSAPITIPEQAPAAFFTFEPATEPPPASPTSTTQRSALVRESGSAADAVSAQPSSGRRRPSWLVLAGIGGVLAVLIAAGGIALWSRIAPRSPAAPSAAPVPAHLTGFFVRWDPVDEHQGFAQILVTNGGGLAGQAHCMVRVSDGSGHDGSVVLAGDPVPPRSTISRRISITLAAGGQAITHGTVTDC
jgi:hypothetical protein